MDYGFRVIYILKYEVFLNFQWKHPISTKYFYSTLTFKAEIQNVLELKLLKNLIF